MQPQLNFELKPPPPRKVKPKLPYAKGSETSIKAAKVAEFKFDKRIIPLIEWWQNNNNQPITPDELAVKLGEDFLWVRPRFSSTIKGILKRDGTGLSRSGNSMGKFRLKAKYVKWDFIKNGIKI